MLDVQSCFRKGWTANLGRSESVPVLACDQAYLSVVLFHYLDAQAEVH